MRFKFVLCGDWPPLAWLAVCEAGNPVTKILHGPRVEVADIWFCEAVWAGEYDSGNFDDTDIVAGSGGRIRGNEIRFVPSGSTTDRLQSLAVDGGAWVSNSLACLMAAARASVNPAYPWYYRDANSVILGLDKYKPILSTSQGNVSFTYFDNLVWDGARLETRVKPGGRRDFSSFEKYRDFLQESLAAIRANMTSTGRRFPLRMMGTLSSGYDSTMISALAKDHGLAEVITFDRARHGDDDGGTRAARLLGLVAHEFDRNAWRTSEYAEVPFVASFSSGEDIIFKGAETKLAGCVLLTGYHGDKIWAKDTKNLGENIVRGDSSGLSLAEYRLWIGFINCAVPFWGVRQIRDIHRISNCNDMTPWDVNGAYSRPICRRVGEQAGIPRDLFGVRKRAVTMNPNAGRDFSEHGRNFLVPSSMRDYLAWIERNRRAWLRQCRVPPIASAEVNYWVNRVHMKAVDVANASSKVPGLWRLVNGQLYKPQYLNRYIFPWAIERAQARYPKCSEHVGVLRPT